MKQAKRDNLWAIVLSIILSYLIYTAIQNQLLYHLSDYYGHTYVYLSLFTGGEWIEGWRAVPYCLWHLGVLGLCYGLHIPLEASVAYVSIFFALLTFYIVYWMLLRYTEYQGCGVSSPKAAFITFGLAILQPIYISWLDVGGPFLGIFSMNPHHNPSQMCVAPFSLLCFALVYDIWNKQKNCDYKGTFFNVEKGLKNAYIYLSVILLISTFAKPTFAEMFIPTVALIMLVEWLTRLIKKDESASEYFKHCLNMFLCAIPALLYILVEIVGFAGSGAEEGKFIITELFEVWGMFTENVPLSVLLGMTFPLFMILIDARFFFKDTMGRLALVGYGIGFLEASLLGESGVKLSHGNFIWPMLSGMLLMFMASAMRLLVLEKTQADSKVKSVLLDIAWFIFWLHVLFGILYIKNELMA